MQLKKDKGKFVPITIDRNLQRRIKSFKDRLTQMVENDEISNSEKEGIYYILNELDTYDLNLLIAYFEYNCSPSPVAKVLGVQPSVVSSRIKKILNKCKSSI